MLYQTFALPHLIPALNILLRLPPFVDANEIKVVKIIFENCKHEGDLLSVSTSLLHTAIGIQKLAHPDIRIPRPKESEKAMSREIDASLSHNAKIVV